MVSLGDLARNLMMQRYTLDAKRGLNELAEELASERHVDLAKQQRGDLSVIAAVEATLARLSAWQDNAKAITTRLKATQVALGALDGIGKALSESLLRASESIQTEILTQTAEDAKEHLGAALGILNARSGEQHLFAGVRSDMAPMPEVDDLIAAVMPTVATAQTPEDAVSAIRQWFEDPGGFDAQIYRGGAPQAGVLIGPGRTITPAVTAIDPAIKQLLVGMTVAAVMAEGIFDGEHASRSELSLRASEILLGNVEPRIKLAATVGLSEARLFRAQGHNAAEQAALEIARNGLVVKDPIQTAGELENARIQLELLHVLTARLSGLSLLGVLK